MEWPRNKIKFHYSTFPHGHSYRTTWSTTKHMKNVHSAAFQSCMGRLFVEKGQRERGGWWVIKHLQWGWNTVNRSIHRMCEPLLRTCSLWGKQKMEERWRAEQKSCDYCPPNTDSDEYLLKLSVILFPGKEDDMSHRLGSHPPFITRCYEFSRLAVYIVTSKPRSWHVWLPFKKVLDVVTKQRDRSS